MFPKTGSRLPKLGAKPSEAECFFEVREALRRELGGTRVAAKMIMRWTGASDRTARNWMSGAANPSAYHLLCLARECDAVLEVILTACGRTELALAADVHAVEVAIAKAAGAIEVLKRQHVKRQ